MSLHETVHIHPYIGYIDSDQKKFKKIFVARSGLANVQSLRLRTISKYRYNDRARYNNKLLNPGPLLLMHG